MVNRRIQSLKTMLLMFVLSCRGTIRTDERLNISEVLERGLRFNNWFYNRQLDSLSSRIVDKSFTRDDLGNFREKVERELGKEVEFLNHIPHVFWTGKSNMYGYVRYSKFSKSERPVETIFGFDRHDNIFRFSVLAMAKEEPTAFAEYRTKTRLRLPFEGEWTVGWGGRTINLNQYAVAADQRFAYDFLISKDGITFRNKGSDNEDYFCFGLRILAPAGGVVVDAVNNIEENKIGEMPPTSGNRVIIDHLNGEFSVLAHFKYQSITVNVGDTVKSGQFLGLCGNSGHSSEPHLHYHLQNSPVMFKGEGLPAKFVSYLADGDTIGRGEPQWSQKVRHSAP